MGHSMAGDAGLEPTHARVKVWCLTDLANPQQKIGVPEGSRTPDTRLRRAVLYPAELQRHMTQTLDFTGFLGFFPLGNASAFLRRTSLYPFN